MTIFFKNVLEGFWKSNGRDVFPSNNTLNLILALYWQYKYFFLFKMKKTVDIGMVLDTALTKIVKTQNYLEKWELFLWRFNFRQQSRPLLLIF